MYNKDYKVNKNEADTVANTIAIAELTQIVKSVANDTDKLVTHIDSLIVCKEKMNNVELTLEKHDKKLSKLGIYLIAVEYPKVAIMTIIGTLTVLMTDDVIGKVATLLGAW